jgi:hypothetical protein
MGIVLFVFFLVGVTVGIVAVIAVSACRADTTARRAPRKTARGYGATSPPDGSRQ